ncbi:MAG: ATP-binding cassette domain-containing protein [Peptococcaceae bacterium]|nr:ATP-binding cassette domain-containing protein [Peptococcaceae bacterium]
MLEAKFTKDLFHYTLNVHFKINNEILVLWGHSGAGKTTILHCLAGLFKPDAGFIKLNGKFVYSSSKKINVSTRHRRIGYVFQDYALFPHMTVRENVLYGVNTNRHNHNSPHSNPMNLLHSFGIGHLADRYPRQLSGGEKQRVALTRSLAVQPQLLLLDEPFSALDRETKLKLRQELKSIHRQWNIPFILVSHDEEDANFLGDVIISMNKGLCKM